MQYSVRVEKSGRILIPAPVRRQLKLTEGKSDVILTVDDKGVRVSTRMQALERVRAQVRMYVPAGISMADDLIADRRHEASEENSK
jgi:AbrB family looped-hinge helix DNA binding protein